MSAGDGLRDGADGGDTNGGDIGGGWGIGDGDTPSIEDRFIAEIDLGSMGTLKLPHLLNIASVIGAAFILAWFNGLNRIITGSAELVSDLISLAFMPGVTIGKALWDEPTEALEDSWEIATSSIGNDAFSFVIAVVIVTAFFLLFMLIINDLILGGEEA